MEHAPTCPVSENNPSDHDQQPPIGDQEDLPANNVPVQVPDHPVGVLDQEGNFPCRFCTRTFPTRKALLEHFRTNPPPRVFSREQLMHLQLLLNPEADDDEEVAAEVGGGGVLAEEAPLEATTESDRGASATTRAPLGIDLNVEPPPELPDLNLSPPPDDGNN